MSERVTVTLAGDVRLAAIERMADRSKISRNAMINNLLRAGLNYYYLADLSFEVNKALGMPVDESTLKEAMASFGKITSRPDFDAFCQLVKALNG